MYVSNCRPGLVKSPLLERLIELDLSMGTLGDEAAEALLSCPATHQLDILNLSKNYLSRETIASLQTQQFLQDDNEDCINIIVDEQKYAYRDDGSRYCSVAE